MSFECLLSVFCSNVDEILVRFGAMGFEMDRIDVFDVVVCVVCVV